VGGRWRAGIGGKRVYEGVSLTRREVEEVELWCGSFGEEAGERAGLMLESMVATSSPMRRKLRVV